VTGWTGEPRPGDTCATVLVKRLESDPAEPLPDGLTFTTSLVVVDGSGARLRRGAGYALAQAQAASRLRVVGLMARGREAAERATRGGVGCALAVGGRGIEAQRCTLHPGTSAVGCD
jgi:hypothetical protein